MNWLEVCQNKALQDLQRRTRAIGPVRRLSFSFSHSRVTVLTLPTAYLEARPSRDLVVAAHQ